MVWNCVRGRVLVAVAVGVVLLGACGGGDDEGSQAAVTVTTSADGQDPAGGHDSEATAYIDTMAASLREGSDALPFDTTQATCVATALVDLVGADVLTEAGILPGELVAADNYAALDVELPDDAVDRLGAALGACDVVEPIKGLMIDGFTDEAGGELPADAAPCLAENLDDQAVADALAATFIDGSEDHLQDPLLSTVGVCPSLVTALIFADEPTAPSPEARACVTAYVQAHPELATESFANGDESTAVDALGTQLALACPEAFGGAG